MNKKQKMKAALDHLFTVPQAKPDDPSPSAEDAAQKAAPVEANLEAVGPATEIEKPVQNPEPVVNDPTSNQPAAQSAGQPEPTPVEPSVASQPAVQSNSAAQEPQPVKSESKAPTVVEPSPAPVETRQPGKSASEKIDTRPIDAKPDEVTARNEEQLVVFQLNQEYFGLQIDAVESIIKMQPITIVPHTADYIQGVTNLRGTVLPVLDLRTRFGLPRKEHTKDTRIIVLKAQGASVGVIVDSVAEVIRVTGDALGPAPSIAMSVDSSYIQGIARSEDRLIILLELEKVLKINKEGL